MSIYFKISHVRQIVGEKFRHRYEKWLRVVILNLIDLKFSSVHPSMSSHMSFYSNGVALYDMDFQILRLLCHTRQF